MLTRLWRGWTAPQAAQAYRDLLVGEIAPGIMRHASAGLLDLSVHQRQVEDEVEFTTLMRFDDWEAVKAFAGSRKPDVAVVPPAAQQLLSRFDATSSHLELVARFAPVSR